MKGKRTCKMQADDKIAKNNILKERNWKGEPLWSRTYGNGKNPTRRRNMVPAVTLKADSHIACCAQAVPLACHACHVPKCLKCVFPILFTQCDRVWFTLAMPCPCHAPTMPFFSRPQHSTGVSRRLTDYSLCQYAYKDAAGFRIRLL